MASQINPQNIDGAYPVAGQDNNSQGFRDNFTNTRTNFEYASQEISDLQSKVVLKAPLTGTTLNNNMGGSILSNAQLQNITQSVVSLGSVSGAAAINYAAGSYYTLSTSGNLSLSFTSLPAAGVLATWFLQITVSAPSLAFTVTLPASVGAGTSATAAANCPGLSGGVLSFVSAGTYVYKFTTSDGGASVYIESLTLGIVNAVALEDLTDVNLSGNIANNSILTYDSANAEWINSSYPSISGNLSTLGDVTITTPSNGDFLTYQSGDWVNSPSDVIYPLTVYNVTVADDGSGSQDVFYINNTALKTNTGVEIDLQFEVNNRYRFDISDPSNANAPLRFSTTPDTIVNPTPPPSSTVTPYNTDVTVVGAAGTPGAYVEILITPITPSPLYFWAEEVGLDTSLIGAALPISVGQIDYFYGEDTFVANGNVSLQTTTTVITLSDNLVGNLAAGESGQIKILAYGNTSVGNTVITVANAAWGGSGTVTLANVGSAATFQYVASKWFCVGNNDVTFG
jgi:hypothetical protein